MLNFIYKGLIAETQKIKGSFTFWFTIVGSIFIPFVFFLVYFFRYESFIPAESINPWVNFLNSNIKAIAFLLFPLHVILTVAININIEHKANSWKKLFVLPIKRENIYISKLIFLLFQIFISLLIFSISLFIFGGVLGFFHKELNFLEYAPDFLSHSKLMVRLFIAILGIFSVQYISSLFFKNIIIPISMGIFLTIVASLITSGWQYSIYFPYSFPMWFFLNSKQLVIGNIETYYNLTTSEITSLSIFIIVNILGIIMFKYKTIK
ncbi:MAG: ABC transporter permease subunit [Chlorobi bacterium]|nr:ABC transporter permease subunit [Chlorobiota bacterium]